MTRANNAYPAGVTTNVDFDNARSSRDALRCRRDVTYTAAAAREGEWLEEWGTWGIVYSVQQHRSHFREKELVDLLGLNWLMALHAGIKMRL